MTSSPKFKVFDCVDIQKRKKIDKAKTVSKAMKEYWLKNRNNQIVEFLIDIGGTAKDDLSRAKVVTGKKQKSCGKCKLFVVNLLLKVQEQVPIQYA